jgi:chromosome segregation ATPase
MIKMVVVDGLSATTPRIPASLAAIVRLMKENESMLTPNRQALADLNACRAAATVEIEELRARVASLARLRDAAAPIEAELASLDAAEAAALADWSATPDAPAPSPDISARDEIVARLTASRQQVAGAEIAIASVERVLASANQRAGEFERQVPALVAAVLVDVARSLLPAVVEATAAVAKVQGRYLTLRKFLLER